MQDHDLADRLAEWCRLSERGWRRDPESGVLCEPEWVRDVPGGVKVWRPLDSDDDCRMVLEACREKGIITRVADELYGKFCVDTSDWGINAELSEWMLMVSPEQKCQAVLKVIGDQT